MKRPVEKHLSHFRLVEVLRSAEGCALCELATKEEKRYFEHLLYESVNDGGVRIELTKSRGYCPDHARALLEAGDGLGTAILYEDRLREVLEFLRKLEEGPWKSRHGEKVLESWEEGKGGVCPACHQLEEARWSHLRTLLEGLGEPEVKETLEAGAGFCFPHLLSVLETAPDVESSSYLIGVHVRKFSKLLTELQEFVRKQDYRFQTEEYGTEKDAWLRAVRMVAGVKVQR